MRCLDVVVIMDERDTMQRQRLGVCRDLAATDRRQEDVTDRLGQTERRLMEHRSEDTKAKGSEEGARLAIEKVGSWSENT